MSDEKELFDIMDAQIEKGNRERIKELEQKLKDHTDWSINEERIEALEKTISSHHDISLIQTKEISEYRKKNLESEFLQIEINKEFEDKIKELRDNNLKRSLIVNKAITELTLKVSNPEWLDILILDLMKPMREVLLRLFKRFKSLNLSFYIDWESYIRELSGDQMSKAEKTIFDEVVRKVEGEKLNPHLQCDGECRDCTDNIPSHGSAPNQCGRKSDSKPEIIKSKLYCSICKSSVALDIIIDDGKRIVVRKKDLKWLLEAISLREDYKDDEYYDKCNELIERYPRTREEEHDEE